MVNKKCMLVVVVIINFVFFSCGLQHWTVGKKFNTEKWNKFTPGEMVVIKDNIFLYEFSITKTKNEREYLFKGMIDGSKGAFRSIGHLVPRKCSLYLILAKNGLVVRAVPFSPIGTDVLQKLPFEKKFKNDPFDSFIIIGKAMARG